MDNSFSSYLQQLELMAFFAGYPLVYALASYFSGHTAVIKINPVGKVVSLLPLSYALTGTLYLGYQMKKFYPNYHIEVIQQELQHPFLTVWALLAVLFWLPVFSKKTLASLLHSLVFFFFLLRDLFLQAMAHDSGGHIVRNDMKLYSGSIFLQLVALAIVKLFSLLLTRFNKH